MKKKIAAVILIMVVIVCIAVYSFYAFYVLPNPPVQLSYRGRIIDLTTTGYINGTFYTYDNGRWRYFNGASWAYIDDSEMQHTYGLEVVFYTDGILYNGKANVSYLATNGTWISTTKEIGIVDINAHNMGFNFSLTDYQKEPNLNCTVNNPFEFNDTVSLSTIRIDAYGYTKP